MKPVTKTLVLVGLPLILGVLALSLVAWKEKRAPDQPSRSPNRWSRLSGHESTEVRMAFLADECEKYKRFYGSWPTQISQIERLLPPDMQEICFDAWGREFHLLAYTNDLSTIWLQTGVTGGMGSNMLMTMTLH